MRLLIQKASRILVTILLALAISACATNPNAPPDPGTKKWYDLRIQEIEASKAAGQLTDQQYLELKNQADTTRSAHLDAMRYRDYPPVGFMFGFGHVHHVHHH